MHSEIGVEYVKCNLCQSDDPVALFEIPVRADRIGTFGRDTWSIVRCQKCGLIYVNPRIDAAARQAYYAFDNPVDRHFIQDWFVDSAELQQATWWRFLRVISRYCLTGKLLDVGCGTGSFLAEARKSGFDVVGQDVSPHFVQLCRQQYDLTVYETDLTTLPLPQASFDCVTAFDVIEHHPDPRQMLTDIHRLLRPGGLLVISTHDIGNIFARFYGPRWRLIDPIGHLTYFTRATLRGLLERCEFQVIRQGGLHTIDSSLVREGKNWVLQSFKSLFLRALILGIYKPLAVHIPGLTRWRLRWRGSYLDHPRLLVRTGGQIVMNDDVVVLARSL